MTFSRLETHVIDDADRQEHAEPVESPAGSFYQVGFNVRKAPFSNPHFRRVVAGLVDPGYIVDTVFDGHATPIAAPVEGEWIPDELAWDGADPISPFFGEDGELDEEAAREAFRRIGYRFDEAGRFVVNR